MAAPPGPVIRKIPTMAKVARSERACKPDPATSSSSGTAFDGGWQHIGAVRAACERAGITPPINFHALRHTWASLAVMAGMPLMVVARNLGHSSTRMVEAHYGHLAPSYVADEIRRSAPQFGFKSERKIVSI